MGDRGEEMVHRFATADDLARWRTWSDKKFGGSSTGTLSASPHTEAAALFSGIYSTALKDDGQIKRSGFVGISTEVIEGECADLEGFETLTYRVRGDGRKYIANIRTDNWLLGEQSDDAWQAFLHTRNSKAWEEIEIPLSHFVLTYKGQVVPSKQEMHPGRVISMGIALAGSKHLQPEGPFKLEIAWIKGKSATVRQGR